VQLLPTPRESDGKRGQNDGGRTTRPGAGGPTIAEVVSLLPTPGGRLGDESNRGMSATTAAKRYASGRRNLDDAAALLPTPHARDWKDSHVVDDRRPSCDDDLPKRLARLLPTPRATDGAKGGPNQAQGGKPALAAIAVELLPTPTSTDAKGSRRSTARTENWTSNPGTTLTDAAWTLTGPPTDPPSNDGNGSSDELPPPRLF